jgi:hypothetical protein
MLRANRVPASSDTLSALQVQSVLACASVIVCHQARADAATIYALQCVSRHRPELDSAFVTASLLSSRGAADIVSGMCCGVTATRVLMFGAANPYVDDADALLSEIATMALHSTRVAHANRVIGRVRALRALLQVRAARCAVASSDAAVWCVTAMHVDVWFVGVASVIAR